jgi:cation diffusion facilitator family transporter
MELGGDSGGALIAQRTALLSLFAAGVLVALKLGVGIATGSLALISAGVESSGDVGAAVITFFAVRLGRRPADPGHPYGHRRAENLGALGESAILLAGGAVVCVEAVEHLIEGAAPPRIHWFQFAVLGVAFVLDLSRIGASLSAARRTQSPALLANALHFAGDMLGTLVVVAGLLAVRAGAAQATRSQLSSLRPSSSRRRRA